VDWTAILMFGGEGDSVNIRLSTFATYVPCAIVWQNEAFDMRVFWALLLKLLFHF